MREGTRSGRGGAALPIVLGVLVTAVVGAAMWRSADPWTFTMDTGGVFLGQTVPAFRTWFAGHVPEWTDLLWGGLPVIGDSTSAALYLPHAIAYALTIDDPLRFFDVAFALHLGIFAAGSAALVRRLGASAGAAVLGGVLAASSPFAHYSAIGFFPVFGAHAWWPWTLVAADALAQPTTSLFGASMLLGWITLAAQVMVGVPEQALYCALPATLWILVRRSPLGIGARLVRIALLGVGTAALAAPQLLPTVLLVPWSQRAGMVENYALGSFWLNDPVQLFVTGTGVLNDIPAFLGIATLALAAAAVLARRPAAILLVATGAVAFALSLGPQLGLYDLLHQVPPFDHFRNPNKLYALAEYGTLWLAALGADALWRRRSTVTRVVAAILVVATIGERARYLPDEVAALDKTRQGDGLFPDRYERLAALTPLRPPPRLPSQIVYDAGGPIAGGYARSVGALLGISSIRAGGVAFLSPAHVRLLNPPRRTTLDLLGVRFALVPSVHCVVFARKIMWRMVYRDDACCIFENPTRPTRHMLVQHALTVDSERTMLETILRGDPAVPVVAPPETVAGLGAGPLITAGYEPGHAALRTVVASRALLLVRDSFAPGWRASVDGKEVTPYPAAGIYFAVPMGPGMHTIIVDYRTPGFRTGLAVCALWLVLALVAAAVGRRRRRRTATASAPAPRDVVSSSSAACAR